MASESRPLLVPQNRKLRHLRGIYLRNLTFALPALRTVDDSELNGSPPSAKKGKRRRGSSLGELGYARSSESLRSGGRRGSGTLGAAMGPAERQRRLQRSVEERIADAFFSLHCEGETPVYLSEIVERASVSAQLLGETRQLCGVGNPWGGGGSFSDRALFEVSRTSTSASSILHTTTPA